MDGDGGVLVDGVGECTSIVDGDGSAVVCDGYVVAELGIRKGCSALNCESTISIDGLKSDRGSGRDVNVSIVCEGPVSFNNTIDCDLNVRLYCH